VNMTLGRPVQGAQNVIDAQIFTQMPKEFRRFNEQTEWTYANRRGAAIDSFLEGPCFDSEGNLYVVDIPFGRVFRIAPDGSWSLVIEYDGEPNGLAMHQDGRIFITDYRKGILALCPRTGLVESILTRRNSESFKGVNDLVFARNGDLYFTDQGQSGLHDPTGRVFRYRPDGHLDCLIQNGPSPNGLALSPEENVIFVAMTRDNSVWRIPLLSDGTTAKVGRFASFHGTSGPDGMAMDSAGNLLVAHASLGKVFVLDSEGYEIAHIRSNCGTTTTNVTFGGKNKKTVFITESHTGSVLTTEWHVPGA
jgi:gluconolactonase